MGCYPCCGAVSRVAETGVIEVKLLERVTYQWYELATVVLAQLRKLVVRYHIGLTADQRSDIAQLRLMELLT